MSGLPEIKMVPGGAEIGAVMVRLSPRCQLLLRRLARTPGAWVPSEQLISAMYPDPDREPKSAKNLMTGAILNLRLVIAHGGLAIETQTGVGYRLTPIGKRSGARNEVDELSLRLGVPRYKVEALIMGSGTSARAILERLDGPSAIGGGA